MTRRFNVLLAFVVGIAFGVWTERGIQPAEPAVKRVFIEQPAAEPEARLTIRKPVTPRCEEDQVLVGAGDFEEGRYDHYRCGPAMDDYVGGGFVQPAVEQPALPACFEDERVWGVGDYADGQWSRYVCKHIDWVYDLADPN